MSKYHWLSTCHDAEIKSVSGDEGTSHAECTECGKSCNLYDKNTADAFNPIIQEIIEHHKLGGASVSRSDRKDKNTEQPPEQTSKKNLQVGDKLEQEVTTDAVAEILFELTGSTPSNMAVNLAYKKLWGLISERERAAQMAVAQQVVSLLDESNDPVSGYHYCKDLLARLQDNKENE